MGDTTTLTTELQIRTTGTVSSINDLRDVASAARGVGQAAVDSGESFGALEHALGRMGGANREIFMLVRGLGQLKDAASGPGFGSALFNTGAMTVAVIALGQVVKTYEQVEGDLKQGFEDKGYKAISFWNQLRVAIGAVDIQDVLEADPVARKKKRRELSEQWASDVDESEDKSPRRQLKKWAEENVNDLNGMSEEDRTLKLKVKLEEFKDQDYFVKIGDDFQKSLWKGKPDNAEREFLRLHDLVEGINTPTLGGRIDQVAVVKSEMAQGELNSYGKSPEEQLTRMRQVFDNPEREKSLDKRMEDAGKDTQDIANEEAKTRERLRLESITSQASGKGQGLAGYELAARQNGAYTEDYGAQLKGLLERADTEGGKQFEKDSRNATVLEDSYTHPKFAGAATEGSAEAYSSIISAQAGGDASAQRDQEAAEAAKSTAKHTADIKAALERMANSDGVMLFTLGGTN